MFLIGDLPQTVVTLTVWTYWTSVCVLVVRSHIRYRTPAGGLPRTAREQWMWGLWVPAIVLWQVIPALAASSSSGWLATPGVATANPVLWTLRLGAAGLAVLAFGLTIPNWFGMGRNWSMAIVPGKRCRLITSGMFSYVRHPIYSLSILLMLSTVAVTLSPAMAVVGAIHITMLCIKAASEERYLKRIHGEDYAAYCNRTGRFFPRLMRTAKARGSGSVREAA
ncbi:MAG: methyltransferase family protein [Planctomycetota bacterium]